MKCLEQKPAHFENFTYWTIRLKKSVTVSSLKDKAKNSVVRLSGNDETLGILCDGHFDFVRIDTTRGCSASSTTEKRHYDKIEMGGREGKGRREREFWRRHYERTRE